MIEVRSNREEIKITIKYAREQNIPVGPGRGSAPGSLAAYCMRITDVDPLQHELLFERFLNPERISMPDIDIDFCIRGRGAVIDHVTKLYGRESACQIVTFGTMASRAAIKDVGRVLNMPYGDVERIAKLIPPPVRGRNVSISEAISQVSELKAAMESDPKVNELVELALKVEGCARQTSLLAAGVVISPKPLHELVPVAKSSKEELTSQYPMNDLEKVGMLKMDFLGLTTLTIISDCLTELENRTGITVDWTKIPTNDPATMKLFSDGRTDAIFQFESSGMQDICRKMKPESPLQGQFDWMITHIMNTTHMSEFLAQVSSAHRRDFIVMVVDGASSHKAHDLVVPESMRLLRLPPYSPELNPQEHVWDELREKEFPNRVFNGS